VTTPPELSSVLATSVPWLALASRLPSLRRRPDDPRLRAWCVSVLFLALALTVFSPQVYLAVDRLARAPNLAQLLGNEATVVSATAILVLLLHVDGPDAPPARRIWLLALTGAGFVAVLAALFLRVPTRPDQPDYWAHYASLPGVAEYRLVYLLFQGYAAVTLTRLAAVYASVSPRPATRLGVRLVAAGGVVGCLYVMDESARVLGPLLGVTWLGALTSSRVLSAAAAGLIVFGGAIPSWGPRIGVDAGLAWLEEYRSLRRLYPLWRALCRAIPAVALVPPPGPLMDALDVRDVHFRLYRRVVEIGDGLVLLAAEAHAPAGAELASLAARFQTGSEDGETGTGRGTFRRDVRTLERLARSYRPVREAKNRRPATSAQMASTTPNGHAPDRKP
jgi:hypothetical protein